MNHRQKWAIVRLYLMDIPDDLRVAIENVATGWSVPRRRRKGV